MKIIHFIAGIGKNEGGTAEYMRLLGNELKNHTELIIATGISVDPIQIEGVRIQYFNTNAARWFALLKEFKEFLVREKPDLVHVNGIWSPQNWGFQKTAQELGIKVVLSPHGMLEPWILAQNPLKKKLGLFLYQKKAVSRADYLHATASMERDSIRALGFKNLICIIPNGIDLRDVKKTKTEYGTKKMIFLSRIHPKKGIELLVEAWANADTRGWTLEIAGNGDPKYIEELTASVQKLKNVNFVGSKFGEAKWDFLRSADVMVLPTHSENFGIVVAEALAAGVPVITTTGTPWEDLKTHQCGWWIDLSVVNLEKAITNAFMSSVETLEKMGGQGRELVAAKYEMKVVTQNIIELYKQILKKK